MPSVWSSYKIHYRHLQTVYHITISRLPADSASTSQLILDGTELHTETLPLQDDRREHAVDFRFR